MIDCNYSKKAGGSVLRLDLVMIDEGHHIVNLARFEPLGSSSRDGEIFYCHTSCTGNRPLTAGTSHGSWGCWGQRWQLTGVSGSLDSIKAALIVTFLKAMCSVNVLLASWLNCRGTLVFCPYIENTMALGVLRGHCTTWLSDGTQFKTRHPLCSSVCCYASCRLYLKWGIFFCQHNWCQGCIG